MGQWFKKFFEKNNCKVIIAGRKTKLTPKQAAAKADIVLISVPIDVTESVIREVGPQVKRSALLIDVTSIKEKPVKAMKKYSKAEVIGMHPVFGPRVTSCKKQTIILTPARGKKWLPWIIKIFKKSKAKITITTPKEHDAMMAIVQGLIHMSSISVCHTLKELGVNMEKSQKFSSPLYKVRMDVIGRILNQDPNLYMDMSLMNPAVIEALKQYQKSVTRLLKIVQNKQRKKFLDYFKKSAMYLGDFTKKAEKSSDYLMEKLINKK